MESISLGNLAALQSFVRTGSLVGAARELNLTSAAVHKQLKQLESALGIRLYEKAGRGLRTTGAATLIYSYAQAALEQVAGARRAAEEWRGLRRGSVRIGAGATLSTHWLPSVLSSFRSSHPDIDLSVDTGTTLELFEQLRAGFIDLAFVLEEKTKPQRGLKAIGRWESRAFLVSGDQSLRRVRRVQQLSSAPYLGFRTGTRFATYAERFFQRYSVQPTYVTRCDNADSLLQILGAGFGFAILPEWILTRPPLLGNAWVLETREKLPPLHVELMRSSAHPLGPAASAFASTARAIPLPRLLSGIQSS